MQAFNKTVFEFTAVSLNVRSANDFVFHANAYAFDFNTHVFGQCVIFSTKKFKIREMRNKRLIRRKPSLRFLLF